MRVHHVERHLHGVKSELMSGRRLQHLKMDVRTLMSSETDVPYFALLLSLQRGFHPATFSEDPVRIGVANNFMKLQQINAFGLKPPKRFLNLLRRRLSRASVNLGHEKRFLPVAIPKRLAHANFALAAVIVPAVIEKINSAIQRRSDDADTLLLIRLHADVVAAQPDHRNFFVGAAQRARGKRSIGRIGEFVVERSDKSPRGRGLEKMSAIHT